MNYQHARQVAYEILAKLEPACDRIEIAGSVRRHKADDIKDIELVCISKPEPFPTFGQPLPRYPIHDLTDRMRSEGILMPRHDKNGRERWGDKLRLMQYEGTPVDLFITTAEQWGVIFTIRTGDADFSRLLVSQQSFGGALPPGWRVEGGRLWNIDEAVETPEESDLFIALGLPVIHPKDRNEKTLRRLWAKERQSAK